MHCSSVIGAEAYAGRRGINEAINLKIKDLIIEGDNLCVINALKKVWKCTWEEDILIFESRLDLHSFRMVEIRHVFRETNAVTDKLIFLCHTTTTNYPCAVLGL